MSNLCQTVNQKCQMLAFTSSIKQLCVVQFNLAEETSFRKGVGGQEMLANHR